MRKIIIFVVLFFPVFKVVADPFVASYFEARKIFEGNRGPWMSAYSDLAIFFPVYSSGKELGIEGQYNLLGPLSLGGKYLSQFPDWSSRNNHMAGPTLQLKFGNSFDSGLLFDVTLRFVPLFDLEEGDFGRFEFYAIFVMEYKRLQVIPAFFYFHTNDFVWSSDSDQFTVQAEIAFSLWYKRIMVLARPEYSKVKSYDSSRSEVANIDIVTVPVGFKGEIPVGSGVTIWGQFSFGPQFRYDKENGAAIFFSAGGRF
jgi:hypothetical protein